MPCCAPLAPATVSGCANYVCQLSLDSTLDVAGRGSNHHGQQCIMLPAGLKRVQPSSTHGLTRGVAAQPVNTHGTGLPTEQTARGNITTCIVCTAKPTLTRQHVLQHVQKNPKLLRGGRVSGTKSNTLSDITKHLRDVAPIWDISGIFVVGLSRAAARARRAVRWPACMKAMHAAQSECLQYAG